MGGSKNFRESGGFSEYKYRQVGTTANGIKIIEKPGEGNSNTPLFSNTPFTSYAKIDPQSGTLNQVSVYGGKNGREKKKDIETGKKHVNESNGKVFKETDIHVHEYDGTKRSKTARKPSKKERRLLMIARYGRVKK